MFAMPAPSLPRRLSHYTVAEKRCCESPLFRREPRAHFVQTTPQRAIVNRVANAHYRPAQQSRIERVFRLDFLARHACQRRRQLFLLRRGQFHRRSDLRFGHTLSLSQNLFKCRNNFGNQLRAPVIRNHEQEIADNFGRTDTAGNLFNHRVLCFDADRRACQKRAQLRRLLIRRAKTLQLLGSGLGGALLQGDIRHRVCVLEACGLQFGIPSRLFTKLLIRPACACAFNCLTRRASAPSTASFAATAFNSSRAARSAASISALAAAAIFSRSDRVATRIRSTSAAASRSAKARSSVTSLSRFASFSSASLYCASAAAFALPALVMAELMASARPWKNPGAFFRQTHKNAPATTAKLIHLKISVAVSAPAAPPSSAACAVRVKKSAAMTALAEAKM